MSYESTAQEQVVRLIATDKVYANPDFNARGHIPPIEVLDLAKDILSNGLLQPIVVRPRLETTPLGYDFEIVAGHRRHRAFQVNQSLTIPAFIYTHLDDFAARTLNAVENLKRKALNPLQESRTINHYYRAGWSRDEIAKELGMSPGWVQVRIMILELPEEIQEAVASGIFTQQQIRDLHGLKNKDHQFFAAKKIKEAKERGDASTVEAKLRKATNPNQKKMRKKPEMYMMQEEIQRACGNNLATRVLAWATGEIDDVELYRSLKEFCDENSFPYTMPDFEVKLA